MKSGKVVTNVDSIPTSSNAAYVRGDSLCSSTNTSDLLLRNCLICDEQQVQSSGILEEPIYSTTGDGYESIQPIYEDPALYSTTKNGQFEQQYPAMSTFTSVNDQQQSSTPSTDSTTDRQKVLNVGTDDCNEPDSNAKCIAQSSDKALISSSAQTPTCCACDTKQTDHPVVIQMADSTLQSEHTGDSERNAEDHRCNEDAADICSNEDYEVAGQVYEHFSVLNALLRAVMVRSFRLQLRLLLAVHAMRSNRITLSTYKHQFPHCQASKPVTLIWMLKTVKLLAKCTNTFPKAVVMKGWAVFTRALCRGMAMNVWAAYTSVVIFK